MGRPKGSLSKIAAESRDRAVLTGELPHEFLLRVSRGEIIYRKVIDPKTGVVSQVQEVYDFESRRDAAKAAAPYFAPKISMVEVITGVNDDELDGIIKKLAAEAGLDLGHGGEKPEDEAQKGAGSRRAAFD